MGGRVETNKHRSGKSRFANGPPYKKDLVVEIYDLSLWALTTTIIAKTNNRSRA